MQSNSLCQIETNNNDDNYLAIKREVLLHLTGQGTHILITRLQPTSIHAFTHTKKKQRQTKIKKQTNRQNTANSMLKNVSGFIKSNDLLLLNFRLFLHYNNASLRLTFIITMERATFPSLLRASQECSPLSSSTTFAITR